MFLTSMFLTSQKVISPSFVIARAMSREIRFAIVKIASTDFSCDLFRPSGRFQVKFEEKDGNFSVGFVRPIGR